MQGASDSGWGVYGRVGSTAGTGVFGIAPAASGATIGVRGDSLSTNGIGALGIVAATSGFTYGVDGRSHSPRGIGTRGLAFGNGTGVLGWSGATTPPQAKAGATVGVQGYASQNAASVGVRGDSTTGRGGLFNGKAAQVRLLPSTAATHPTSGQKGDLFVDTAGRLWFCKGATSWKQLA